MPLKSGDLEEELALLPESIELPILETPTYSETKNFGGGLKVAVVTLDFKDFIEDMKTKILEADAQGNLGDFEVYEWPVQVDYKLKFKRLETPVAMTYADHLREGQKKFISPTEKLAAEILEHGYHNPKNRATIRRAN